MKEKKFSWWWVVLLAVIVVFAMSNEDGSTDSYSDTGARTEDEHIFLDSMGYGGCDTLTGDVLLTVIFVDDFDAKWTDTEKNSFISTVWTAAENLEDNADDFGVDLDISINYYECRVYDSFTMNNHSGWVSNALDAAGLPGEENVAQTLKSRYGVDSAPVIFAVNRTGRSFASQGSDGTGNFEFVILYDNANESGCRHEIFHLYGAKDFYYPDVVQDTAERYLTNSIMYSSENPIVDDFTAYLIGWKDTLSSNAKHFLDETEWITQSYMNEAYDEITLTGYGTIRYDECVITGYFVDGEPNGEVSVTWNSGDTYVGEWRNGGPDGYGTFRWAIGDSYTGYWSNGTINGSGTYTFSDGTRLKGKWRDGQFIG